MVVYRRINTGKLSDKAFGHMLGWSRLSIQLHFDMYNPCGGYGFETRRADADKDVWPLIEPEKGSKVAREMDDVMAKMIKATWKTVEPSAGVQRGMAGQGSRHGAMPVIGTRGGAQPAPQQGGAGYKPDARPTESVMNIQQAVE